MQNNLSQLKKLFKAKGNQMLEALKILIMILRRIE
jgi:hypothetical protein